ncbi:glycosyltransferase [Lithospermum erythrorhizon]|uniref:Glycosyltransferase n=1 Tax=Lithospermum erythrorhizon TaxID=34254 RepID=A0AAV3R808_LITER
MGVQLKVIQPNILTYNTIRLLAQNILTSSKFCLNPAGDTPSSCRLFDAIVSHCVPVIVSDELELPYEDELDYSEFSVFFSDEEASRPKYQYPPKKDDAVNMIWKQISHKLPAVQLAEHRNRRLKIPGWWR